MFLVLKKVLSLHIQLLQKQRAISNWVFFWVKVKKTLSAMDRVFFLQKLWWNQLFVLYLSYRLTLKTK